MKSAEQRRVVAGLDVLKLLGAPASRRPVGSRKPELAGETPALPGTVPRFRSSKREIFFYGQEKRVSAGTSVWVAGTRPGRAGHHGPRGTGEHHAHVVAYDDGVCAAARGLRDQQPEPHV